MSGIYSLALVLYERRLQHWLLKREMQIMKAMLFAATLAGTATAPVAAQQARLALAVIDPTADIGIGFIAGKGPVTIFTEARWLPSRFDARFLPIRSTHGYRQWQNDWLLKIGFRARP